METEECVRYFRIHDDSCQAVDDMEFFLLSIAAQIRVLRVYRMEIKQKTSDFSSHVILRGVIGYLLSISVTSINAERSFSCLKSIYRCDKHQLKDGKAFGLVDLMSALRSGLVLDITGDFHAKDMSYRLKHCTKPSGTDKKS